MVYDGVVKGKYVQLVSVTEEDAEFTLKVRQDPRLTKYLPKVNNTLEQQREWIRKQRLQEDDYYFVAKDYNGNYVGTIGIYHLNGKTGEGGRLTSIGNALQSLEIQYLAFRFDFDILNLEKVTAYVYADNAAAYRLSEKLGTRFEEPSVDDEGRLVCNGSMTKEQFKEAEPGIRKLLYREKQ